MQDKYLEKVKLKFIQSSVAALPLSSVLLITMAVFTVQLTKAVMGIKKAINVLFCVLVIPKEA